MEVALPPLRERMEDLPPLIDHFLHAFNERFQKDIEGVSQEVLNKLMLYSWPGNVRELEHAIEHAFILCRGKVITLEHLPVVIKNAIEIDKIKITGKHHIKEGTGDQEIIAALDKTDGNKAKAARLLGINRRTLYRKINKKQPPLDLNRGMSHIDAATHMCHAQFKLSSILFYSINDIINDYFILGLSHSGIYRVEVLILN